MITLKYDKEKKKTSVVKKNLNPVFMKQFYFDRVLSTTSKNLVEIIVDDYDLSGNDFMGRVTVPLVTLKSRKEVRRWFKLENKEGTNDGKERGEILLALRWTYDKRAKPPVAEGGLDALEDLKPTRRITTLPKQKRKTIKKKEVRLNEERSDSKCITPVFLHNEQHSTRRFAPRLTHRRLSSPLNQDFWTNTANGWSTRISTLRSLTGTTRRRSLAPG